MHVRHVHTHNTYTTHTYHIDNTHSINNTHSHMPHTQRIHACITHTHIYIKHMRTHTIYTQTHSKSGPLTSTEIYYTLQIRKANAFTGTKGI